MCDSSTVLPLFYTVFILFHIASIASIAYLYSFWSILKHMQFICVTDVIGIALKGTASG